MSDAVPARGFCIRARYCFTILASLGMGIVYGTKVSLHVAIIAMVNHTALEEVAQNGSGECDFGDLEPNESDDEDGPFLWNHNVQGIILSSYFLGYLVSQIPGGQVAELVSAKWVMFFSVLLNVGAMLLVPITSKMHYIALSAVRVVQGIGGGVSFPGCHVLLASWSPPNERSVMSSLVYAGTALGTVIFMLVSGLIAHRLGWEMVFYIEGAASAVWLLLWIVFAADGPDKQRFISEKERSYILSTLDEESGGEHLTHLTMPWKAAFKSSAFWAIIIAHTCGNWGWYMVLIELPMYMKTVLQFEMRKNAGLTALPFFTMWIFSLILSEIMDVMRTKSIISTTTARKVSTLFASLVPMICFIVLCIVECNRVLAVTLMIVAITCIGGMFCGYLSNHIDIAPHHAGTLMGITNTIATIPGIAVPLIVGALTQARPGLESWRIVFISTISLYAVEIIVYMIWGSGKVQSWDRS